MREGNLKFSFPQTNGSEARKYDECSFYRNQFSNVAGGTKGVDFIYIDKTQKNKPITWLIEVKDYRHPDSETIKPSELASAVAEKARDTLAGLVAARHNANCHNEKDFSNKALKTRQLRVILHLEQKHNYIDPADILTKLKQQVKAIDAHPKVISKNKASATIPWQSQDC